MARLAKAWPPVFSALLLLAAFPPFNLGLLVIAGLVPWFLSLRETDGRGAFKSGYLFGLVYMLGQLHWLQVLTARWTQNNLLGVLPWVLAGLLGALYFALTAVLVRHCWKFNIPWAIPIVWAGIEVFRSYIPVFAFPYGLLAMPLWPYPWIIQLAHFGMIYLVSAWVVLANVLLCFLMLVEPLKKVRLYLATFLVLLMASLVQYSAPEVGERKAITIGQPGTDLAFGEPLANYEKLQKSVRAFYDIASVNNSHFLLLPEGIAGDTSTFPPKPPFAIDPDVPVVFGGRRGEDPTYQSAFSFDGTWQYADKTRLVIFGEFVPGRNWIPFLNQFNLPSGDLVPGERVSLLEVKGLRVGPVICFESLFPDIAYRQALNGAQVLTVMSVDDWYFGTGAPEQLKASSVWRAIETGLPLVRSASLGYSMAVTSRGQVIALAPVKESIPMRVEVVVQENPKPMPILPAFPILSFVSLPTLIGYAFWRARKTHHSKKEVEE